MIPDDLYPILHTIVEGDTLYNLAKRYDTTVNDILHGNPHISSLNLPVGEVLTIFPKREDFGEIVEFKPIQ